MNLEKEREYSKKILPNREKRKKQKPHKKHNKSAFFESSESIQHIHGLNHLHTMESMTGLKECPRISKKEKNREVFRAENSYGNISIGGNKKKEAMVIVSQKREPDGKTTKESQKNLHMERKHGQAVPSGEFLTNNSEKQSGAVAYRTKVNRREQKILPTLEEYASKKQNEMMEKRMPFLGLNRDKEEKTKLREKIRHNREQGLVENTKLLERRKEELQEEIHQKEENQRMMQKKIKLAWEKVQKLSEGDWEQKRKTKKKEEKIENLEENTDNTAEKEKCQKKLN